MRHSAPVIIAAAALICLLPAAGLAALSTYSQNFETLNMASPTALSGDGWVDGNPSAEDQMSPRKSTLGKGIRKGSHQDVSVRGNLFE